MKKLLSLTLGAVLGLPVTAATFNADFNTGTVPAGSSITGSAAVTATGGFSNTGVLRLTEATGGQVGGWLINDFSGGVAIKAFSAAFKVELGNGTATPADGFSFNWATNLTGAGNEEGEGNGLTIAFDTFDNGGSEAPAIDVKWNGATLAHSAVPFNFTAATAAFVTVGVSFTNGFVSVSWNSSPVHANIAVPGFGSFAGAKFSFCARTGAATERHYIDDVSIVTMAGSGSDSSFSLASALQTDTDANGKISPGDRLRYTIAFTNTFGSNLLGAILTDTNFSNQTLVGGSITATPLGHTDAPATNSVPGNAFHGAFNTTLTISAGAGLLTNDFPGLPTAQITSFGGGSLGGQVQDHAPGTGASAPGAGTLTVNADGSLSFVPTAGFCGTVTFLYRLANTVGTHDTQATIAIGVRPAATNDNFNVTGNTMLDSSLIPQTLIANDAGSVIGVQSATAPAHGTVTFSVAGNFTYTPAAGYTGPDSFNYTITNGFGGSTGVVNLTIANKVWYIDNSAGVNGDGRSTSPFKLASDFSAVNDGGANHPADNDTVFLRQGAGNYVSGITLRAGQRIFGDGISGTLSAAFGFTVAPGSAKAAGVSLPGFTGARSVLSLASGTGLTLGNGNTVRGMNVQSASGKAISGVNVGTVTITNVIAAAAGAAALDLTTGTAMVTLDTASSTNSTGQGINLSGLSGAVTINGGTIQNPASDGVTLSSASNISLSNMLIRDAGRHGVFGTSVNSFTMAACTVQGAGDAAGEHGIYLTNLTGAGVLRSSTITNSTDRNVYIANASGTASSLMISNCAIARTDPAIGEENLCLEVPAGGSGAFTLVTVTNSSFQAARTTALRANIQGTGSIGRINVYGCAFTSNDVGIDLAANGTATLNFDLLNNTLNGTRTQINVANNDPAHNSGGGPSMQGRVKGNNLTSSPAGNTYIAMWIVDDGDGSIIVDVDGNTVANFGDSGIDVESRGGTGRVDATIRSNIISTTATFPVAGVFLRSGNGTASETSKLYVNLASNNSNGGSGAVADYYLDRFNAASTTFAIQGLSPSPATPAQTQSYVITKDSSPPATAFAENGSYINGTPTLPTLP